MADSGARTRSHGQRCFREVRGTRRNPLDETEALFSDTQQLAAASLAAAALAVTIFVVDAFTPGDVAVAVLYVAVG